jgi:hypothetical protein
MRASSMTFASVLASSTSTGIDRWWRIPWLSSSRPSSLTHCFSQSSSRTRLWRRSSMPHQPLLAIRLLGESGTTTTHTIERISLGWSPPILIPRSRLWIQPLNHPPNYMALPLIWYYHAIGHLNPITTQLASFPNCPSPLLMTLILICGSLVLKITFICILLIH